MRSWTILVLCVVGGCVANSDIDPPRVESVVTSRQSVIGKSVQGREIRMAEFGTGARPVLIMGGIHGNETASVIVAGKLVEELSALPEETHGVPVTVIPVANPDGFEAKTRQNARGVDLNRNFPAANWKKGAARKNNGAEPLSEPESRALYETIERLKPRLIISIHSIDAGRHCNNYDGPGEPAARAMNHWNGYPVAATIGYPTPGSLGSFAGIDKQIAMVTLELPRDASGERAWKENREALLAAIRLK